MFNLRNHFDLTQLGITQWDFLQGMIWHPESNDLEILFGVFGFTMRADQEILPIELTVFGILMAEGQPFDRMRRLL